MEDGTDGAGAGLPAVRVVLPADFALPESCGTLMEELSRVVYAHGNDNQKGQAMLCGVYFRWVAPGGAGCPGGQGFQRRGGFAPLWL